MRRSCTAHVRIPLSVPPLPSDGLRRAALWERAGIIKECVGENVSTHHTDRGAAAASCFRVAETMVTGGAAVARLPLPVSVAGDEFSKRHHTGTSRSTALQHEDASSTATIVNDDSTDAAEKPPATSVTDTTATTPEEIATDGSKPAGAVQAVESSDAAAADEPATQTSTADAPTSEATTAEALQVKKKAKKEKRKQIQKERREERARSMSRGEERLHRLGQCADTVKYLGPDGVALFESQRGASKWGRAAFILVSAPKHHTHEFHEAVSESLRERNAVAERAYAAAVADFNRTHGTHGQGGRVADQAARDNSKSGKKKHQKDKSAREVKQLSAAASAIEAALQMDAVTPPAAASVDTVTTASNADTETAPATSTSDTVTDTAETTSEESSVDQSTHADGVKAQEIGGNATAPVREEPFVFPELRLLNVKSYTKAYIAFFAKASAPIDSRRRISSFFSTAERLSAAGLIDVSGRNAGGCTTSWLKSPREKDSESVGDTHATSPATNGDGETASDVAASAETKNDERRATFEMLFTRKMKRELANAAAAAEKKFKQSKKVDTVRGKAKGKGDRMRGMNVATKSHVASVFTGLPVPAFGHTNAQRKARALAESQRRATLNKDSHRRGSKDTKATGKQKSTGKSSDEKDNEKKAGSTKTTADVGPKEYPVDPGLLGPSKYDCLVAWAESLGPLMAPVPSQVHQYRSPEHMAKCGLDVNSEGTSDVPGPALSETFDTPRWKQFDRRDRTHDATTDHNAVSTAATEFDELLDAAADAANCDVALMWRGVAPNAPATPNGSEDPHVNVDNTKGENEEDEGKEDGVTNVRHHNVTVFLVPRGAKGTKDGEKPSGPRTFQIKSNGAGDATTASDAPGLGTTDSSSASSPLPPTSTSSARESVAPKARVQAFLAGLVTVKPSASVVQLQHPSHRSVYRASLVFSGPTASSTDSTASSTTTEVGEGKHAPVSGGENPDGEKPQIASAIDVEMKIVVLQSKKSGTVPQGLGAAALLQASPSALHTAALTAAAQRSKLRFQTCGLVDAAGDVVATPTVEDAMAVLGLKAGLDIKM